jgi:chemotaxis regulatin CheY-phosphate phosphatase CheZ
MEYNKLVAVSGLGGLFELIASKADGGIVRSLDDKSTKFVSNRVHSFSHLESIEVYTSSDNVNLVDVFEAMSKTKEPLPAADADAKAIRAYFEKVYPTMDFERVYGSDMKKMVKWFEILQKNNVEIKLSELSTEEAHADSSVEKKTAASVKSAPKTTAVKNAPAKKINTPRKMA